MATLGDPALVRMRVLIHEFVKDVWIPMGPLVLLTIIIAPYSVYRTLRPLARAAQQADVLKVTDCGARLSLTDLPREAASFATAINRLMGRVGELVQSQKLLISRAAHELRTPLSIILLELGKIADPRARRAIDDVVDMSNTVDRLLQLARIDAMTEFEVAEIDITVITQQALDKLRPLAQARNVTIRLDVLSPQIFRETLHRSTRLFAIFWRTQSNTLLQERGFGIDLRAGAFMEKIEDNGAGLPEDNVQALFCHNGTIAPRQIGRVRTHRRVPLRNLPRRPRLGAQIRYDHSQAIGRLRGLPQLVRTQRASRLQPHRRRRQPCESCHRSTFTFRAANWDSHRHHRGLRVLPQRHQRARANLRPTSSTTAACETCHKSTTTFAGARFNHAGITTGCASCHNGTLAPGMPANHIPTSVPTCETCHGARRPSPAPR